MAKEQNNAYYVLNPSLEMRGMLSNTTSSDLGFYGDTISQGIAGVQDVLAGLKTEQTNANLNLDVDGNNKEWTHSLSGLSFNDIGIGSEIKEGYYLAYYDNGNDKYYLMRINNLVLETQATGIHTKTASGVNAFIDEASRIKLRAKSFTYDGMPNADKAPTTKGTAANILQYALASLGWNIVITGEFDSFDYEISEGASAQSVIQDIIPLFDADVDAYVNLTEGKPGGQQVFTQGNTFKKIFNFSSHIGRETGDIIRYGKNLGGIHKTSASDMLYTKIYVTGKDGITFASINNGKDYIVDDDANKKYNPLGATGNPTTYYEGQIANTGITEPQKLLSWGYAQLKLLNHARFNYTVDTLSDTVGIGDGVRIQDDISSEPIYLSARVVQKTISLANPTQNSFMVGEFGAIKTIDPNKEFSADLSVKINNIKNMVKEAQSTAEEANVKAETADAKATQSLAQIGEVKASVENNLQIAKDFAKKLDDETRGIIKDFQTQSGINMADTLKQISEANTRIDKSEAIISDLRTNTQKSIQDARNDIADIRSNMNSLGQVNQLFNSEFNPDLANWKSDASRAYTANKYNGSMTLEGYNNINLITSYKTPISQMGNKVGIRAMMFAPVGETMVITVTDGNSEKVIATNNVQGKGAEAWTENSFIFDVPANTPNIVVKFSKSGVGRGGISQPMMVFDVKDKIGPYVPGSYNNNEQIVSIQSGLDGALISIRDNKDNLASIKMQSDNLSTNVTNMKTELDSSIKQTNDRITTEVADRKAGDNSILTQTATNIASAVKGLATESLLSQTSNKILASVQQTNLVPNSEFENTNALFAGWGWRTIEGVNQVQNILKSNTIQSGWSGVTADSNYKNRSARMGINLSLKDNSISTVPIYTGQNQPISGSIGALVTPDVNASVIIFAMNESGSAIGRLDVPLANSKTNDYETTVFPKWTTPPGTLYVLYIIKATGTTGKGVFEFTQPFLARQSDWVAYTPGTAGTMSNLVLTQDMISSTVSDYTGKISTINQTINSINTRVKDNATGLSTLSIQTDERFTQVVNDMNTADSNILTQSKNFTTSQITNATNNLQSTITQTANGIYATVGAVNQVVDSSLQEGLKHWKVDRDYQGNASGGPARWRVSKFLCQGIPSFEINSTVQDGVDVYATSEPIPAEALNPIFYAQIDVKKGNGMQLPIATNYVIARVNQVKADGSAISTDMHTAIDNGNFPSTDWTTFARTIVLDSDTVRVYFSLQMHGNGHMYYARPYIGNTQLEKGRYISGPITNSSAILELTNENFALGIKNNINNIISGINGSEEGVKITGKNIILDGNTSVLGDFWSNNINAITVKAENLQSGTITGMVISGGTITGNNIILDGGQLKYNYGGDILAFSDDIKYWGGLTPKTPNILLKQAGEVRLQSDGAIVTHATLTAPNSTGPSKFWYLDRGQSNGTNTAYVKTYLTADGLAMNIYPSEADGLGAPKKMVRVTPDGIYMGNRADNPNIVMDALNGTIQGEKFYLSNDSPGRLNMSRTTYLGTYDASGSQPARFAIRSYQGNMPTVSASANTFLSDGGAVLRVGSARRLKTNITYDFSLEKSDKLIDLRPAQWYDKAEVKRYNGTTEDAPKPKQYIGMIAEELDQAGLEDLVVHNEEGIVQSISYDRLAVALIPGIRNIREKQVDDEMKIRQLEARIKQLEELYGK